MQLDKYHALTRTLQATLEAHTDVLALVALGSMAASDRQPDQWSDHDFFLITRTGTQQGYRERIDWLPSPERVILHFQETDHGCKAIYDDGHILEYAVFDLEELRLARINSYRILFDKAHITDIISNLKVSVSTPSNPQKTYDTLLSNLLVGAMRAGRGENLSAHAFIRQHALRASLDLYWQYHDIDSASHDSLDPYRRFEEAFPETGAELTIILSYPPLKCALAVLDLCERTIAPHLPDSRHDAIEAIRARIQTIQDAL